MIVRAVYVIFSIELFLSTSYPHLHQLLLITGVQEDNDRVADKMSQLNPPLPIRNE